MKDHQEGDGPEDSSNGSGGAASQARVQDVESETDARATPNDAGLQDPQGRADLVVGLIGAIGTKLDKAEAAITESLRDYAYEFELVKLSDFIKQFDGYRTLDKNVMPRRDYFMRAIDGGNAIREAFKDRSALAQWAVVNIHARRARALTPPHRARCFVIDQIKCPEEVRFLREVYGPLFYCLAVYADEDTRERRLTKEFKADGEHKKVQGLDPGAAAHLLMERDQKEKGAWGQNVRGAFVEADYFIRSDQHTDLFDAVKRFFNLVLSKPYVSPTKSEVAMMHARTAALRSADLSRQVGAVVVARDGRILTTGCNEVPKAGGGQYWEGDIDDSRDFRVGYDANDRKKEDAIFELLDSINDKIMPVFLEKGVRGLQRDLQDGKRFDDTLMDSLIEFGRIVHAEQAAMNAACLDSVSIRDGDLYCTTYPCHMCARQIINVGIRNVFYIEPYPKSAAVELYEDSIIENPKLSKAEYLKRLNDATLDRGKVYFIPFEGVAPRRYSDLFGNGRRKATAADVRAGKSRLGDSETFNPLESLPRLSPTFASPVAAEGLVISTFQPYIDRWTTVPETRRHKG